MTSTQTRIGERLKSARLERGLSQEQLARCAGVVQSAISAFEAGEKEPRLSTLKRISSCLKISTSVLIDSEEGAA